MEVLNDLGQPEVLPGGIIYNGDTNVTGVEFDGQVLLAEHLTDWLFYARPEDSGVQQLVFDVYKARILDADTNTMEMLTYPDQMTAARERSREK